MEGNRSIIYELECSVIVRGQKDPNLHVMLSNNLL